MPPWRSCRERKRQLPEKKWNTGWLKPRSGDVSRRIQSRQRALQSAALGTFRIVRFRWRTRSLNASMLRFIRAAINAQDFPSSISLTSRRSSSDDEWSSRCTAIVPHALVFYPYMTVTMTRSGPSVSPPRLTARSPANALHQTMLAVLTSY